MTNQTVDALLYLLNKHYRSPTPTPTAIVVRAWESQQSTLSAAVQHDFQHSHPHTANTRNTHKLLLLLHI